MPIGDPIYNQQDRERWSQAIEKLPSHSTTRAVMEEMLRTIDRLEEIRSDALNVVMRYRLRDDIDKSIFVERITGWYATRADYPFGWSDQPKAPGTDETATARNWC